MRVHIVQYGETSWTIARDQVGRSNYQTVPSFRQAMLSLNNVDDGRAPVIRDWTRLPEGTVVRLPG